MMTLAERIVSPNLCSLICRFNVNLKEDSRSFAYDSCDIFYTFDSGIFLHIRICNCDRLADDRPLKTSASSANIFLGEMFPIDAVGH